MKFPNGNIFVEPNCPDAVYSGPIQDLNPAEVVFYGGTCDNTPEAPEGAGVEWWLDFRNPASTNEYAAQHNLNTSAYETGDGIFLGIEGGIEPIESDFAQAALRLYKAMRDPKHGAAVREQFDTTVKEQVGTCQGSTETGECGAMGKTALCGLMQAVVTALDKES